MPNKESSASGEFALASPGIRMAPSLLAADFTRLGEHVDEIECGGATVLHLDVMDGHFVPNLSYGAVVIEALRDRSKMFFDTHLMIEEPKRYAESFVKAGSDLITFHIEVVKHPEAMVGHLRELGVAVGVSINPTTPISAIESIIDDVDLVLVMSIWPGFGGQKFMPEVLDKVVELKKRLGPHQRLEIDGGIGPKTVGLAAQAGVDTLVAGTAIFRQPDPVAAMKQLYSLAVDAVGKAG